METILRLCEIVNKQKLAKIDVFGAYQNPTLLVNQFYEGIKKGKIKTEADAREQLYGSTDENGRKLRAVKKRLEDKLINTLFFIDADKHSHSDYEAGQIRTYLSFSAVQLLRLQNQFEASAKLAEKCLNKALQYHMVDLAYLLCQDLVQFYCLLNYSSRKSKQYLDLEKQLFLRLELDKKANRCFIHFASYINQNKKFKAGISSEDIKHDLADIQSGLETCTDYNFNYKTRNALFFQTWLEGDIESMKVIVNEALDFFQKQENVSTLGSFSFHQKLGFIHEQKKDYTKAIEVYERASEISMIEGGTSWYNIRSRLFDANLQLGNYQSCFAHLKESITHPSFKRLFANYREPWIIREAYLNLLIEIGMVEKEENQIRSFSLVRFKNDVDQFSKDKRGLNIAIIIVQALHYLARNRKDDFEKSLQSLGQYSMRYLRQDDTVRSKAFIKMLKKLPELDYHPVRWRAHCKKLTDQIKKEKANMHYSSKEKEIIPYEQLIELIVKMLRK